MEIDTFTMHLDFEQSATSTEDNAAGGEAGRGRSHSADKNNNNNNKARTLPVYNNSGIAGFEAGLEEISKIHPVMPIPAQTEELIAQGLDAHYTPIALQLANNDHHYAARLVEMMQRRREELTCTTTTSNTTAVADSEDLEYTTAQSAESEIGPNHGQDFSTPHKVSPKSNNTTTPGAHAATGTRSRGCV
eukprot:gene37152-42077_t